MRAMLGLLMLALICLFLGFSIDTARTGGVSLSDNEGMRISGSGS